MKIHLFDKVAEDYTNLVSPKRQAQFLTLIYELKFNGTEEVLDIGCGPGKLSIEALKLLPNGRLVGIDLSPQMILKAKETAMQSKAANAEFLTGDAMNLQFGDDRFDIVFSSNAFPWVADQSLFLEEAFRVLKPGGKLGLVSLSRSIYKEFFEALAHVNERNPRLFPKGIDTIDAMRFKTFDTAGLTRFVSNRGFKVEKAFTLSTEEPIVPNKYINRVNAIINENYLDELDDKTRDAARNEIYLAMARHNGSLAITESSVFIIAEKPCR